MALAELTSARTSGALFTLLAALFPLVVTGDHIPTIQPFRYDDTWRTRCAGSIGSKLYRNRELLVSTCLSPGTRRDDAVCCRARHQPILLVFMCSRNGKGWTFQNSAQRGLTVVTPEPPPASLLAQMWVAQGKRGASWGGSPQQPFTAAQKAVAQRIVRRWLTGPDGSRVLLMALCEWQAAFLRELLPAEERRRVLSPPTAAFQAFEGAVTGKSGTGPWLRVRQVSFWPQKTLIFQLELDVRGHTQARGAALSCLRLKLADIVLIWTFLRSFSAFMIRPTALVSTPQWSTAARRISLCMRTPC